MEKQKKQIIEYPRYRWTWLWGFLGLYSFRYFIDGNAQSLFLIGFLSFFGYYFTYKLAKQKEDERMIENHKKAKALSYKVPYCILIFMLLFAVFGTVPDIYLGLMLIIAFVANILTYTFAFYYLEKYT